MNIFTNLKNITNYVYMYIIYYISCILVIYVS